MKLTKDIVVIGAGITGLTTALHLKEKQKDFIVLEKRNRVGGVIQTKTDDNFIWEEGPNSALISNKEVVQLFDKLKGICEPEIADEKVKKRYVLKNGKWHALPSGPGSAASTPLFTTGDKFRVLGEPFRSPGTNPEETLAQTVKRRLGKSFLDYAIDPFILGVYAGDPDKLITKYALPKLYNLEQNYGSFIRGSMKKKKEPKTEDEKRATREIFSVKGGLTNFTESIFTKVGSDKFMLGFTNVKIAITEESKYKITGNYKEEDFEIIANKVITTTGAHELKNLLAFVEESDIKALSSLPYAKVVEVALGFKNWTGMKLDAFGGLIPHKEKRDVLGVMFMSALLKGRAPENGALFSIFCGGIRRPEIVEMSDNEIISMIERETISLMNIPDFNPDLLHITRHKTAIPQYGLESKARFETIDKLQKQHKGLVIGGNLRDGIGMADRIAQASKLVEEINE